MAQAVKELGPIGVLINNASALWWKSIEETPMKRYDLINGINTRGTFACSRAVLPSMREAGWGHIVTQSPPIVLDKMRGMTAYNISKFGMTLTALGARMACIVAHAPPYRCVCSIAFAAHCAVAGIAQEYRGLIAGNSIWPTTLIESFATANHKLGDKA
jgi:NAD(P)-dependent dehydrogenase (short-subunit alcohol dehydrogenase family)